MWQEEGTKGWAKQYATMGRQGFKETGHACSTKKFEHPYIGTLSVFRARVERRWMILKPLPRLPQPTHTHIHTFWGPYPPSRRKRRLQGSILKRHRTRPFLTAARLVILAAVGLQFLHQWIISGSHNGWLVFSYSENAILGNHSAWCAAASVTIPTAQSEIRRFRASHIVKFCLRNKKFYKFPHRYINVKRLTNEV